MNGIRVLWCPPGNRLGDPTSHEWSLEIDGEPAALFRDEHTAEEVAEALAARRAQRSSIAVPETKTSKDYAPKNYQSASRIERFLRHIQLWLEEFGISNQQRLIARIKWEVSTGQADPEELHYYQFQLLAMENRAKSLRDWLELNK